MNRSHEHAADLLERATDDLRMLQRLAGDSGMPLWGIGFHAHQAVEKSLKAVERYPTPFLPRCVESRCDPVPAFRPRTKTPAPEKDSRPLFRPRSASSSASLRLCARIPPLRPRRFRGWEWTGSPVGSDAEVYSVGVTPFSGCRPLRPSTMHGKRLPSPFPPVPFSAHGFSRRDAKTQRTRAEERAPHPDVLAPSASLNSAPRLPPRLCVSAREFILTPFRPPRPGASPAA